MIYYILQKKFEGQGYGWESITAYSNLSSIGFNSAPEVLEWVNNECLGGRLNYKQYQYRIMEVNKVITQTVYANLKMLNASPFIAVPPENEGNL